MREKERKSESGKSAPTRTSEEATKISNDHRTNTSKAHKQKATKYGFIMEEHLLGSLVADPRPGTRSRGSAAARRARGKTKVYLRSIILY